MLNLIINTTVLQLADPGMLFLILLVWAFSSVGFAYFIAGVFQKRSNGMVFSYLYVILTYIASEPIVSEPDAVNFLEWLFLLPPVAISRSLGLLFQYELTSVPDGSDLQKALLYLLLMGVIFFVLGVYFATARYEGSFVWFLLKDHVSKEGNDEALDRLTALPKDVARAAHLAETEPTSSFDVVVKKLRKVFPPQSKEKEPFVAINSVSFGIHSGECFGLLGPNGAGKTTTLNCLTASLRPTEGQGFIMNKNVVTEREAVYDDIGICPQFDVVFEDLTVQDHLFFYSRLKGVSSVEESALVQSVAASVQLDGDAFHLKAGTLSGGMMRRLSIAISLIGNPKVWMMDEPSTGLSPDARRQVWDIIEGQKAVGRTIIITTHSMEEADTLCSRIGIMARGNMRCIGTQDQLKEQYGDGFLLTLSCDRVYDGQPASSSSHSLSTTDADQPLATSSNGTAHHAHPHEGDEASLREFIQSVAPSAKLNSAMGKVVRYMVPIAAGDEMLNLFRTLEVQREVLKARFGIQEWELGQTTLEEVFIRAVKDTFEEQ